MQQKIFFALGTVNTITLYTDGYSQVLDEAADVVHTLHQQLSMFEQDSEVTSINRFSGRKPVTVSPDTFTLIKDSVRFSEQTDGCFDITTGTLNRLWKQAFKTGQSPDKKALRNAGKLTNYRDILLDESEQTVKLRKKGQQLDLGAIAKGYAADKVCRLLKHHGITEALLNFGGTVVCMGKPRTVGIQNPFAPTGEAFAAVTVENRAVVSSGIYEQGMKINGQFCHHIINPLTGYPCTTDIVSITLIGQNAEALDALATSLFMTDSSTTLHLLRLYRADMICITSNREIFASDGLKDNIHFLTA